MSIRTTQIGEREASIGDRRKTLLLAGLLVVVLVLGMLWMIPTWSEAEGGWQGDRPPPREVLAAVARGQDRPAGDLVFGEWVRRRFARLCVDDELPIIYPLKRADDGVSDASTVIGLVQQGVAGDCPGVVSLADVDHTSLEVSAISGEDPDNLGWFEDFQSGDTP